MAKFTDIFEDVTKQGTKIPTNLYLETGMYPIIDQGQSQVAGYTNETEGLFTDIPAIIFGDHTRIIKYVDTPCFLGADGVKLLKAKDPNANYKYLYYALCNADIPNTGYNRHFKWLKEIEIPAHSIEEQNSIVAQLQKIDTLSSLRKQQLSKLDELVKSRFIEMFGGVHDSKIYPYKAVKELTDVVSGGTPSRDISEYWEEGTIPWVKTTELQNNIVTEVEEYITEQGLSNSSAKIVPSGTVLIAMYGQGKTRGMTAYLGIEACTNQACACILPSAQINQTFLWQFFILSYDNLRDMAKGGNQPNLNGNMIKNYPILCPPRELQEQFATFVEQTDKLKFEIQKSLEKLETLKKALMQKYFG